MRPGERIRLIKEAASSLISRPWADIQLTLSEFGIETWEPSSAFDGPDNLTYCTQQLQNCNEDKLIQIHEYLLGEDAAPSGQAIDSDTLWGNQPARAFLSHAHEQRLFVADVKTVLGRFGVSGFVAHADIDPSKQWRNTIKEALATCHLFVAFLDERFHQSQWCDQEVGWALARDISILPIQPAGFDRARAKDGFLEEHQDICLDNAKGRTEPWVAEQIFNSLFKHSKTRDVGVAALAEALVNSGSFDQTRRLWAIVELQSVIEAPQLRRLEYAAQANNQVYDALLSGGRPAPDAIKALVQKFEPPEEPF